MQKEFINLKKSIFAQQTFHLNHIRACDTGWDWIFMTLNGNATCSFHFHNNWIQLSSPLSLSFGRCHSPYCQDWLTKNKRWNKSFPPSLFKLFTWIHIHSMACNTEWYLILMTLHRTSVLLSLSFNEMLTKPFHAVVKAIFLFDSLNIAHQKGLHWDQVNTVRLA